MGKIIQPKTNFTVVSNNILRDKRASLQAKGLYSIMRALPDNWNFSVIGLASLSSNGREATNNAVLEMEELGYLKRNKYKTELGQFDVDYILYNTATNDKAVTGFPATGHPATENPLNKQILNKQILNNINTLAKDKPLQDIPSKPKDKPIKKPVVFKSDLKEIAEVIKAMCVVDPKNKLYYANTTQKGAVDFLIQEYTLSAVLSVIEGIPQARATIDFFPSITTPCELRDKWVKAFEAINRKRMNSKTVIKTQSV